MYIECYLCAQPVKKNFLNWGQKSISMNTEIFSILNCLKIIVFREQEEQEAAVQSEKYTTKAVRHDDTHQVGGCQWLYTPAQWGSLTGQSGWWRLRSERRWVALRVRRTGLMEENLINSWESLTLTHKTHRRNNECFSRVQITVNTEPYVLLDFTSSVSGQAGVFPRIL